MGFQAANNPVSRGAGIPLTRGQVNPGRPCLAPPGVSKSESSLVFIGRERFWDLAGVPWIRLERPLSVGGRQKAGKIVGFCRSGVILVDFMRSRGIFQNGRG